MSRPAPAHWPIGQAAQDRNAGFDLQVVFVDLQARDESPADRAHGLSIVGPIGLPTKARRDAASFAPAWRRHLLRRGRDRVGLIIGWKSSNRGVGSWENRGQQIGEAEARATRAESWHGPPAICQQKARKNSLGRQGEIGHIPAHRAHNIWQRGHPDLSGNLPPAALAANISANVPRILLAEDTPASRLLMVRLLSRGGYQVATAENGKEAIELFQSQPFDAVLMDLSMPIMDGFEATQQIRALENSFNRHVPIIAITAHASAESRRQCSEVGMDAFVTKPVDIHRFLSLLRSVVAGVPTQVDNDRPRRC
jgi:CheY-like chemotaxis protein